MRSPGDQPPDEPPPADPPIWPPPAGPRSGSGSGSAARSDAGPGGPPVWPPPPTPPPEQQQPIKTPRYGWIVGLAAIVVLAYITVNTIRTTPHSSTGLHAGQPMPPFAMPLARSHSDKDANVATRPDEGSLGARPACEVRGPQILNSCELAERGPVVLAFFTSGGGDRCIDQLDTIEAVRPRFPKVRFAAVAIRGSHAGVRRLVREHHWRFPVGWDRDGIVSNLYGVPVCPMIVFAHRGGVTQRTTVGSIDARELTAAIRRLR